MKLTFIPTLITCLAIIILSVFIVQGTNPPPLATLSINENHEIVLLAPDQTLSAVALRLKINSSQAPKLIPNQNLIDENWAFPIKKVSPQANEIFIDLAAVNLTPEGHQVNESIILAKLDFDPPISDNEITINFDANLTKVITKTGLEFSPNLP